MSFLKNLPIKQKIFLLIMIPSIGFLIYGVLSYSTLNTFKVNGGEYEKLTAKRDFASDTVPAKLRLVQAYLITSRLGNEADPAHINELIQQLSVIEKDYDEAFKEWKEKLPEGEIKNLLVNDSEKLTRQFYDVANTQIVPAARSGDRKKIEDLNDTVLDELFRKQSDVVAKASKLNAEQTKAVEEEVASSLGFRSSMLIFAGLAVIVLGMVLGWFLTKMITDPLAEVVGKIKNIALGDTNQKLDFTSKDEIGELAEAFRNLNQYIQEVAGSVALLGKGDLSANVRMRSDKDLLSKNVSQTIEALKDLVTESKMLIESARNGNLGERGNAAKFDGAYNELVGGMNQMLDAIVTPINEASAVLEKIGNRDLTAQITSSYKGDFVKIKDSVNLVANNLDDGFQQVALSAEQVAAAAAQISGGSQSLAQSASEQASTIEEVSSSLQEISSMTQQNATNSKEARSLSDSARGTAERGMKSMEQLSDAISKIKESSDSTAKIVKTIEEIAFQTNLLALNAAVEAARAGDAGKGFAVVAEEVRNLAMRSAEAAKSTAQLIDEAVTNTNHGVSLNDEVKKNLGEINEQIEQVSVVISEIAAASDQQNQGVTQINIAIEQMNGVTQQTAANSEESASAAEELSSQSQEMLSLIDRYKLSNRQGNFGNSTFNLGKVKIAPHGGALTTSRVPKATKKSNGKNGKAPKMEDASALEKFIPFDDMNDSVFSEF